MSILTGVNSRPYTFKVVLRYGLVLKVLFHPDVSCYGFKSNLSVRKSPVSCLYSVAGFFSAPRATLFEVCAIRRLLSFSLASRVFASVIVGGCKNGS